jgi:hypothetical protein
MIGLLHTHGRLALGFGALLLPIALVCAPAHADGTPVWVRDSVVSLDGSKLIVRAKDGKDVSVSLADNFAALAVVKLSMADIKRKHVRWHRDRDTPCDQWKSLYSRINCVEPPKATTLGTPAHQA